MGDTSTVANQSLTCLVYIVTILICYNEMSLTLFDSITAADLYSGPAALCHEGWQKAKVLNICLMPWRWELRSLSVDDTGFSQGQTNLSRNAHMSHKFPFKRLCCAWLKTQHDLICFAWERMQEVWENNTVAICVIWRFQVPSLSKCKDMGQWQFCARF